MQLHGAPLQEVEDFVARHGLDEAASEALRSLPAHQQQEAMVTDLNNCRNPSAVFMARVRDLGKGGSAQPPSLVIWKGGSSSSLRKGTAVQAYAPFWQQQEQASFRQQVDDFLSANGIDETAAADLRELPEEAQLQVIEVELKNCRNPSAVVSSRIKEFWRSGGVGARGAGSVIAKAVEDYIWTWSLDERVAQELRTLPAEAQQSVIESAIVNARNPSAIVTRRIQDAKSQLAANGSGAWSSWGTRY